MKSTRYEQSGVSIRRGDSLVSTIKRLGKSNRYKNVVSDIGGFGGLFPLDLKKWKNPILVSGTDGVGTKLKVAFMAGKYDTVGIDLVAMNVNDLIVCGATPLFFLDYLATSKLDAAQSKAILTGILEGCLQADCKLLGGETAEMPGFYAPTEFDLAGFSVGVVEKKSLITGKTIRPGNAIIGFGSSGLHSNGFSLVRKILFEENNLTLNHVLPGTKQKLLDALLTPTRIYVSLILSLMKKIQLRGLVHITGGGFYGNIPRILPETVAASIDAQNWNKHAIFDMLQEYGDISEDEMFTVFNNGIGMIAIVDRADVSTVLTHAGKHHCPAWEIGRIITRKKNNVPVIING